MTNFKQAQEETYPTDKKTSRVIERPWDAEFMWVQKYGGRTHSALGSFIQGTSMSPFQIIVMEGRDKILDRMGHGTMTGKHVVHTGPNAERHAAVGHEARAIIFMP